MHAGALSITFNGEIYNYQPLRAKLENDRESFQSDSDTEVLLKLYARQGTQMFGPLRGVYAFDLWDANRQEMPLARDSFGIKPLSYGDSGGKLWFASQARALVDTAVLSSESDVRAWNQFLLWGSVPEPRTARATCTSRP